jgi:hypothetical protein
MEIEKQKRKKRKKTRNKRRKATCALGPFHPTGRFHAVPTHHHPGVDNRASPTSLTLSSTVAKRPAHSKSFSLTEFGYGEPTRELGSTWF